MWSDSARQRPGKLIYALRWQNDTWPTVSTLGFSIKFRWQQSRGKLWPNEMCAHFSIILGCFWLSLQQDVALTGLNHLVESVSHHSLHVAAPKMEPGFDAPSLPFCGHRQCGVPINHYYNEINHPLHLLPQGFVMRWSLVMVVRASVICASLHYTPFMAFPPPSPVDTQFVYSLYTHTVRIDSISDIRKVMRSQSMRRLLICNSSPTSLVNEAISSGAAFSRSGKIQLNEKNIDKIFCA